MGATSQYRPDTRAPGGGGMDYNGNPVGGGMGAQFNMGGPSIGFGPAPRFGAPPAPGDLYQPGGGRFTPRGMVPPAGARPQPGDMTGPYTRQRFPAGDPRRYGNPRQLNPGQPGLQPGMMPPGSIGQPGGPTPMPSPVPGRGKGGGGGKGGFEGPGRLGRPGFGPAPVDPGFDPGFFDNNQNPDADAYTAGNQAGY